MKKSIFAVMAFVVAAMLVGCNKDKENSEVAMTVSEITDSTAVINCEYTPAKSVSYKLQIGESVSEEYRESMEFTVAGLNGGTKYNVVATTYDAEHKEVGTTVTNFRTTGEPDNSVNKPILFPESLAVQIKVYDNSDESVTVNCTKNQECSYTLSCDNGGVFSETGTFTTDKTLTLLNLQSGTEYTITTTVNLTSGETKSQTKTFTKE